MKLMIRCKVLLLLFTIVFVLSLTSSPKTETDKDSIRANIYQMIEQADSLKEVAQYDSAMTIGQLTLEKAEIKFGTEDTTVAAILNSLGKIYFDKGKYADAEQLYKRALAIGEKALGSEHPKVANSLFNLAVLYLELSKHTEALQYQKRALTIREKIFGREHLAVAQSLDNIGAIYQDQSKYPEAESLYRQALEIRKKTLGPEHPDVGESLDNIGFINYVQGRFPEAESFCRQALGIREKALGPEHPNVGESWDNIGLINYVQGKFAESGSHFNKALAIKEKALGPEHPDVAISLHNLRFFYYEQAKYAEAEQYEKRALAIREKALGPEHPLIANSLENLVSIYSIQGNYDKAERFQKRALEIMEKTFGPEHPNTANSLSELGHLYCYQDKFTEAEPLFNRALAILEKVFGPENADVAHMLHTLATFNHVLGKYTESENLYKRVLALREKVLGPEHPYVAGRLHDLAKLYRSQGKYAEAASFFRQAIAIYEKVYGRAHKRVAQSLAQLAVVYEYQGKYAEAESSLKQSIAIWEKVLGTEHLDFAFNWRRLALFYSSIGKYDEAITNYVKLNKSNQNFIDYSFSNASEDLKMSYIQMYPLMEHSFFSFAMFEKSKKTIKPALEMALKSKAIIIDAVSAEKEIAYCSYDDELLAKAEKHANICGEIATLALAGAENHEPEIYRKRMQTLNDTKDSLEIELSRECAEFKDELASRHFTVEEVAKALPASGILLEFIRYEPYDFKKIGSDYERTGLPRYLTFTLDRTGKITLTDLGDAAEIDSLVTSARKMIYNAGAEIHTVGDVIAETRLNKTTGRLYNLIWAPLESSLGGKTQVFISPDGQLSLLPFEILSDNNGTYAIERYNISYLSSGRDLLKFKKKPEYGNWALAMADPDFDLSQEMLADQRDKTLDNSEYIAFVYEPSRGASECLSTRFNPLPYTKKETKSVVKTLKKKARLDVDAYYGDQALEEVLKRMTIPPRVLHLSTHGYFCEDIDLTENRMLENPLLRSGLALAGANRLMTETEEDVSKVEDGILTAFEVSSLNLTGTELVTLSACETGVGEVQNGEGVYGLRRAFQHAGAKTILMSLWKVPDKETYNLMDNFYKNWAGGQTKQEAFRQSVLKVIENRREKYGAAHPYYWGAFVLLGDPE